MPESSSLNENDTPVEYPIPRGLSKVYAQALSNLLSPNLAKSQELFEKLPPEHDFNTSHFIGEGTNRSTDEKEVLRSNMQDVTQFTQRFLQDLGDKKVSVVSIHGGYDFKFSDETNTAEVFPNAYPIEVDEETTDRLRKAFLHRIGNKAAAFTYPMVLADSPEKTALKHVTDKLIKVISDVGHSNTLRIILDESGQPTLEMDRGKESFTIPAEIANTLGEGLTAYLDDIAILDAHVDKTNPFGSARQVSRLVQTLRELKTAKNITLTPDLNLKNDPDAYELHMSEFSDEKPPKIQDMVIVTTQTPIRPFYKSLIASFHSFASTIADKKDVKENELLQTTAQNLKDKLEQLAKTDTVTIKKNEEGKIVLEIDPLSTPSHT